jgi:hypothetical protein
MPIPFQQDKLLYNVYDNLPMGVGFTRVFNNTAQTLVKFKALHLDTDGVRLADASLNLPAHGFAWNDIDPDEWGYMAHDTVLYQLDWFLDTEPSVQYLTQGATYFLATQGNITPNIPTSGLSQELGTAMSIHEFAIELQTLNSNAGALDARITALENNAMLKSVYDIDDDGRVDALDETPELLPVTVNGQTVFTLSSSPVQPALSRLTVNEQTVTYGIDYTIALTTLTWISTKYPLSTTDTLHIIYR